MPTKNAEAPDAAIDELDAGWEDEEREEDDGDSDDADLDAGWDAVEAAKTPEEREREWRGLTPEERAAREARIAERREKLRAKAAAKAERRKARASQAKAKQKQKQRSQRPRMQAGTREAPRRRDAAPAVDEPSPDLKSGQRARARRNDPRVLAFLVAIVLLAGAVAVFLWKR